MLAKKNRGLARLQLWLKPPPTWQHVVLAFSHAKRLLRQLGRYAKLGSSLDHFMEIEADGEANDLTLIAIAADAAPEKVWRAAHEIVTSGKLKEVVAWNAALRLLARVKMFSSQTTARRELEKHGLTQPRSARSPRRAVVDPAPVVAVLVPEPTLVPAVAVLVPD